MEGDLHTHTVGSPDAYGTIIENAKAASETGLKMIAITDHGPKIRSAPSWYYFLNLRVLPKYIHGVRVIRSVEANILDDSGSLDLPDEALRSLELIVAGLHSTADPIIPPTGEEVNWYTECVCQALKGEHLDIVAHPGNPRKPVDPVKVVKYAKDYGKAIEINDNSFTARPGSRETCSVIARLCAQNDVWVSVASDAHSPFSVGKVDSALKLAQENGIRVERIVNSTVATLKKFMKERGKELEF